MYVNPIFRYYIRIYMITMKIDMTDKINLIIVVLLRVLVPIICNWQPWNVKMYFKL